MAVEFVEPAPVRLALHTSCDTAQLQYVAALTIPSVAALSLPFCHFVEHAHAGLKIRNYAGELRFIGGELDETQDSTPLDTALRDLAPADLPMDPAIWHLGPVLQGGGAKTPPLTSFFCVERVTVRTDGTWQASSLASSPMRSRRASSSASTPVRSRRQHSSSLSSGSGDARSTAAAPAGACSGEEGVHADNASVVGAPKRASFDTVAKQGRLCVAMHHAMQSAPID